jgi:hypothetical protein
LQEVVLNKINVIKKRNKYTDLFMFISFNFHTAVKSLTDEIRKNKRVAVSRKNKSHSTQNRDEWRILAFDFFGSSNKERVIEFPE